MKDQYCRAIVLFSIVNCTRIYHLTACRGGDNSLAFISTGDINTATLETASPPRNRDTI